MNARPLYRGAIPTSPTTVYTVPNGIATELTEVVLTNTTSANISVTLSIVPGGGAGTAANEIYGGFVLLANGENTDDFKMILGASDSIVVSASAVGANTYITGVEAADSAVVQVRD